MPFWHLSLPHALLDLSPSTAAILPSSQFSRAIYLSCLSCQSLVSRPTRWYLWYWYLDVYVDHIAQGFQIQVTEKYTTAMCYINAWERKISHLSWRLLFRIMLFPEVFESTSKLQYVLVRVFEISMMVRYQDWLMWIIGIRQFLQETSEWRGLDFERWMRWTHRQKLIWEGYGDFFLSTVRMLSKVKVVMMTMYVWEDDVFVGNLRDER